MEGGGYGSLLFTIEKPIAKSAITEGVFVEELGQWGPTEKGPKLLPPLCILALLTPAPVLHTGTSAVVSALGQLTWSENVNQRKPLLLRLWVLGILSRDEKVMKKPPENHGLAVKHPQHVDSSAEDEVWQSWSCGLLPLSSIMRKDCTRCHEAQKRQKFGT